MEFYSTRANEVKHRIIKLTVFVGKNFGIWNDLDMQDFFWVSKLPHSSIRIYHMFCAEILKACKNPAHPSFSNFFPLLLLFWRLMSLLKSNKTKCDQN